MQRFICIHVAIKDRSLEFIECDYSWVERLRDSQKGRASVIEAV
jgi:hypothetical protein